MSSALNGAIFHAIELGSPAGYLSWKLLGIEALVIPRLPVVQHRSVQRENPTLSTYISQKDDEKTLGSGFGKECSSVHSIQAIRTNEVDNGVSVAAVDQDLDVTVVHEVLVQRNHRFKAEGVVWRV